MLVLAVKLTGPDQSQSAQVERASAHLECLAHTKLAQDPPIAAQFQPPADTLVGLRQEEPAQCQHPVGTYFDPSQSAPAPSRFADHTSVAPNLAAPARPACPDHRAQRPSQPFDWQRPTADQIPVAQERPTADRSVEWPHDLPVQRQAQRPAAAVQFGAPDCNPVNIKEKLPETQQVPVALARGFSAVCHCHHQKPRL